MSELLGIDDTGRTIVLFWAGCAILLIGLLARKAYRQYRATKAFVEQVERDLREGMR